MHLSEHFLTHAEEWVLEDLYEAFHAQSKASRREGRFGFSRSCANVAGQLVTELTRRYRIQRDAGYDVHPVQLEL